MNNTRRKALTKILDEIDVLKSRLEDVLGEEQEALDNIPESLQYSERYERAEEAVSYLDDAVSSLEEAIENIESAIE